jgi:hypothetical protein
MYKVLGLIPSTEKKWNANELRCQGEGIQTGQIEYLSNAINNDNNKVELIEKNRNPVN